MQRPRLRCACYVVESSPPVPCSQVSLHAISKRNILHFTTKIRCACYVVLFQWTLLPEKQAIFMRKTAKELRLEWTLGYLIPGVGRGSSQQLLQQSGSFY
ncbi:hypothetical protein RRG08_035858 [Elysia crispata]|uniref:Uncharacterized protein n=1 Tax=Elysia crispata TaxID=231223 RepID=A0AAE1B214_9GAST|nr:hypothetical protein RRG08_035858 [Elysia crispata]